MATVSRFLALILLLPGVLPTAARAQTELAQERASLLGIDGFHLSVDVEGPRHLLEQEELDLRRLVLDLRARLREMGLTVYEDKPAPAGPGDVRAVDRGTYLHVHVNMMDAGRGLVPFAVEAAFYQPVLLARDPSQRMAATTWGTSLVGIVSLDNLPLIGEAAAGLVNEFAADFRQANP